MRPLGAARRSPLLGRAGWALVPVVGALAWACAGPTTGWIRTELYLGRALPDAGVVSPAELDFFLAREAAPRLTGWTLLEARGHWTAADGGRVDEPTSVLVVVHPTGSDEGAIEELRRAYARELGQESVLRVDVPVGASFEAGPPAPH